jgi:putative PIN family toxin of toxin-antitoxin system
MRREKLVIDTNIWVSYFLGDIDKLVTAVYDCELQIFTTQQLVDEIEDVLQRPKLKKYFGGNVRDCVKLHLSLCERLPKKGMLKSICQEAPDSSDNFLFDLCLAAKAKILVSGDKPLLEAGNIRGIQVKSWKAFKKATGQ